MTGIFGGAISDYELSTERINGRVGICGYDLRWNGKVYSGFRGCGQQIEAISVSLPATMAKWSDVEVAGALGMLMNVGGPIRVDRLADNSAEFRNAPGAGRHARAVLPAVLCGARRRLLRCRGPADGRRCQRRGSPRWTSFRVDGLGAPGVRVGPGVHGLTLRVRPTG